MKSVETVEEFKVDNGKIIPIIRKEITREISPDMKAVRLFGSEPLSDGEIAEEAQKLKEILEGAKI